MNKEQYNYLFNKVTVFKDMEDYLNTNVYVSAEDFKDLVEQGEYQTVTRGLYNGATNTFTPNTLNAKELVLSLQDYLYSIDWLGTLYTQHEDSDDLETFEKLTRFDVLEDYLNCHDVFTIGNNIYIDSI
ncbi:hypothetical protein [Staphylococcus phage ZCSS1]|uniref:Uncharacterized protein n=1 Tax=Staphylococcus phage UHP46 TaxID=3234966 RepID=A0AB39C805_9CAUD|nr:hypothetical protein [Staphylococcus phage ZCSS1]